MHGDGLAIKGARPLRDLTLSEGNINDSRTTIGASKYHKVTSLTHKGGGLLCRVKRNSMYHPTIYNNVEEKV